MWSNEECERREKLAQESAQALRAALLQVTQSKTECLGLKREVQEWRTAAEAAQALLETQRLTEVKQVEVEKEPNEDTSWSEDLVRIKAERTILRRKVTILERKLRESHKEVLTARKVREEIARVRDELLAFVTERTDRVELLEKLLRDKKDT